MKHMLLYISLFLFVGFACSDDNTTNDEGNNGEKDVLNLAMSVFEAASDDSPDDGVEKLFIKLETKKMYDSGSNAIELDVENKDGVMYISIKGITYPSLFQTTPKPAQTIIKLAEDINKIVIKQKDVSSTLDVSITEKVVELKTEENSFVELTSTTYIRKPQIKVEPEYILSFLELVPDDDGEGANLLLLKLATIEEFACYSYINISDVEMKDNVMYININGIITPETCLTGGVAELKLNLAENIKKIVVKQKNTSSAFDVDITKETVEIKGGENSFVKLATTTYTREPQRPIKVLNYYMFLGENQDKLFITLETQKVYSCCNYGIATNVTTKDEIMYVEIQGIVYPEKCLTAIGPAEQKIELSEDVKKIMIRQGDNLTTFDVDITKEAIKFKLVEGSFIELKNAENFRRQSGTFAFYYRSDGDNKHYRDDFAKELASIEGVKELIFEDNSIPIEFSKKTPVLIYSYDSEETYSKVIHLLYDFSREKGLDKKDVEMYIVGYNGSQHSAYGNYRFFL